MANHAESDFFRARPLKPRLKLGSCRPCLAGSPVEWLLQRVIDEDVLDTAFAEPSLDQTPLACGVEVLGVKPPMRAGRAAALKKIADVDIAAGLMASVLIERAAVDAARVAYLDPWGVRVGVVKHVECVQQLICGVLRDVGTGSLADHKAGVGRYADSVDE